MDHIESILSRGGEGCQPGGLLMAVLFLLATVIPPAVAQEQWQASGLEGKSVNRLKLAADGSIYAATGSGLFRSTDNGGTWSGAGLTGNIAIVAPGEGNWIYASGASGLSRSSDGGATWSTMPAKEVSAKFGIVKAVAVDNDGKVYIGNTGPIWGSIDHGATWAQLPGAGLPEGIPDINVIEVGPSGELLAASWGIVGGSLYGSVDAGESWIPLYNAGSDIQAIGTTPSGGYLISAYRSAKLYRSGNQGATWDSVSTGQESSGGVVAFAFTPGGYYALIRGGGVIRSTDMGSTWSPLNGGLPGTTTSQNIAATRSGTLLLATKSGVYRLSTTSAVPDEHHAPASGGRGLPDLTFNAGRSES